MPFVREKSSPSVPTEEILQLAKPKARVIDLHGRTATPGLIDSHAHIATGGVDELYSVSLSDAATVDEVKRRVQAAAVKLKPGEWLTGAGWDEGKLAERRYIVASDLDEVAPNNPVWLMHTTGHYGVANHEALRLAHITAASKDPPAGTIDRDPQGVPTGVLKEAAMDAVVALIPPPTPEQWRNGILRMVDTLHREGMTAVKDPDIRTADLGRLSSTAAREETDRARLRALARRHYPRICTRSARPHPGATPAAEFFRRWQSALLRSQALYGWKRRRQDRLGL